MLSKSLNIYQEKMGKKFLERMSEAFEEDTLTDLIPEKQSAASSHDKKKSPADPAHRSKRKQQLRDSMENALDIPSSSKGKKTRASKRKSFLDTIEEALEDNAFDILMPTRKDYTQQDELTRLENRFGAILTRKVLARADEIAKAKKLSIKQVINIALERYIEIEAQKLKN